MTTSNSADDQDRCEQPRIDRGIGQQTDRLRVPQNLDPTATVIAARTRGSVHDASASATVAISELTGIERAR